jgi:hypothetical protein
MDDVQKALEILNVRMQAAEDKRAELEVQIKEADTEITNLSKAIKSVLTVMGVNQAEPISQLGITDAIRRVTHSQSRMSATQIRIELEKEGFDCSGYQNVMASIYRILTRLVAQGQLEIERDGSNVYYKPLGINPKLAGAALAHVRGRLNKSRFERDW